MTDRQVRSDEARRNLRNLLDEVALGARITILRYDKPAALLVPVPAASEAETGAQQRLAEIRAILAAFDWERDDSQYALERIEMIADGGQEQDAGSTP
jgi:antitoxin (DNA-binding transcriptional repressor) of toxin-antitoxin stability system